MTFREKLLQEHPEKKPLRITEIGCPDDYGYEEKRPCWSKDNGRDYDPCWKCWNRPMLKTNLLIGDSKVEHPDTDITEEVIDKFNSVGNPYPVASEDTRKILDSGNRRQFSSGAVRDIQDGKGRCDLMALDVVADYIQQFMSPAFAVPIQHINKFQETGDSNHLLNALYTFTINKIDWNRNHYTMLLEVSKHFEEGAKKYGPDNWRKGIPVHCYIDSAVRHYLKFLRGDKDEPHDRAFCWNIVCAIWTCKHKPELNEYARTPDQKADIPKRDYDPVARAYDMAKKVYCDDDKSNVIYALEEIVGYLGEALDG